MAATTVKRGGRMAAWTREDIIHALQRYAALHGDAFTTAAFNPSVAKWRDRAGELVERYYAGDTETGEPWPSLNTIKKVAGGDGQSFNVARVAAGLEPNKPGPRKRRPDGVHAPVRNVSHVGATRTVFVERDAAVVARERDDALERLERATQRIAELRAERPKTKVKIIRDPAPAEASVAKVREARATATRLAARLERAEATIATLRADKRLLARSLTQLERRAAAAAANVHEIVVEVPVEVYVDRPAKVVERVVTVTRPAPEEAVLQAARDRARAAEAGKRAADVRAEKAEKEYLALALAARGIERRLTHAELTALKRSGPAGPAVLASELKELARARAVGGRRLHTALTRVAAAAVSWRERLP